MNKEMLNRTVRITKYLKQKNADVRLVLCPLHQSFCEAWVGGECNCQPEFLTIDKYLKELEKAQRN